MLTLSFAALFLPMAFKSPSLYGYVFPLFAIGITYVLQFRDEFPLPWKLVLIGATVVSIVALALDWAFSGHILWNVVFMGHARRWGRHRGAWMLVFVASLVHLFVLKIAFQRDRDVVGGFLSVGVALVVLIVVNAATNVPVSRHGQQASTHQ